jgi:ABC-type nitrate/sulfonate/bicarbonate transport system permease component
VPKQGWSQTILAQLLTRDGLLTLAGRIGVLIAVGGGWQLASTYRLINPVFAGIPTRIVAEFFNAITGPIFSVDAVSTVSAAITGAAIASIFGISTALSSPRATYGGGSLIPISRC